MASQIQAKLSVDNLMASFNKTPNDNTWFSGWSHKVITAQYGVSKAEAKNIIGGINQLSTPALKKAVVKEFAARIADGRFYFTAGAQTEFKAIAAKLGITDISFKGEKNTSHIMG